MKATVTNPRALDPAYGPNNVYELASKSNTEVASVNADSYTMTATAMCMQRHSSSSVTLLFADHRLQSYNKYSA